MTRLIPVGLVMLALSAAFADTHYVDAKNGVDEGNDGTDPTRPLKTIEAALDAVYTGDTLMVADGTYYITRPMWASKHLRILGASGDPTKAIIDAQGKCSCVSNSVQWVLSGLTFRNGYSEAGSFYGAGVYCGGGGTTTISNCVIRNCRSHCTSGRQVFGGGVYFDGQELGSKLGNTTEMVDCLVEDCAVVSVSDYDKGCSIYGGGIYAKSGVLRNVTIRNCSVTNSSTVASDASSCGGGGLAIRGDAKGFGCVVTNCFCVDTTGGTGGAGGGAYVDNAKIAGACPVLSDSLVAGNHGTYAGGGVYLHGPVILSGCTVRGNWLTASAASGNLLHGGGGVYAGNSSTQITIENCLIEENQAANEDRAAGYFIGGGLYVYRAGAVAVSNTVVRNNLSNYTAGGCGFYGKNGEGTNLVVRNCVFEGNVSTNHSGAIYFYTIVDALVENVLVKGNVSASGSGGIGYVVTDSNGYFKDLTYRNCLFASNYGAHIGFGFYLHGLAHTFTGGEFLTFDHCTFAGNTCGTSSRYLIQAASNNDAKYGKLRMTGCAFVDNMAGNRNLRGIQPYTGGATNIFRCWADAADGVPTVDPALGNFTGGDPGFVDAEAGDVRLTAGSPLIGKGGPFEDWMGNGRRKSVQDMGDGTYALTPVGKYGVSVTMNSTRPRRGAADASDIGCCSYWMAPGALLFVR